MPTKETTRNFNTLIKKVEKIAHTDYDHENPFEYCVSPAIGKALRSFIKKEIEEITEQDLTVISDSLGYGFYSGFIGHKGDKNSTCVYFNINFASGYTLDHMLGLNNILYRTAKNTKDFTGGSNQYSDYEHIGECLMDLFYRTTCPYPLYKMHTEYGDYLVFLMYGRYPYSEALAIDIITTQGECWNRLTVNLPGHVHTSENASFVDSNNNNWDFKDFLIKNHIAKPTGVQGRSGFCIYPEYEFDLSKLNPYPTEDE